MSDFTQRFDIIYKKYLTCPESATFGSSKIGMSRFLGISQGRMQHWESGRIPNATDCLIIAEKLGFKLKWVISGEDVVSDEHKEAKQVISTPHTLTPAIPVVGLASCGVEGLEQIMPYHMTASPIALSPKSFAVLASGESMVPAGIASGHMCFCDPDQQPLPGEAVFLRQKNNLGALKLFLGEGGKSGFTNFQGWLAARDEHGHQKPFTLQVNNDMIDCIAPVVCIRRRG
ncbi:hypothetical protein LJC48_01105 [Desulfovibrio sp. OttesenSCG-928-C06]|nr:hypothetical protein [Desulfovibrio sp. OttesenSCG-928-C06]